MTKYDFSHLFVPSMEIIAGFARAGERVWDDMFFETLEVMSPPLLPAPEMAKLMAELDPKRSRKRGRPAGNILVRRRLGQMIEKIERPDFPHEARDALVDRLMTGKRFTEFDRSLKFHKAHRKVDRHILFRCFYRSVREALATADPPVHHLLGLLDRPPLERGMSPRDEAVAITHRLLHRYNQNPPSRGRLRNLVAPGNYPGKRD